MSAHSCSELCDIDQRFHDIIKFELDKHFMEAEEMREYLIQRLLETTELMKLLPH